jgi:COMPASS component SPP1
MAFSLKALLNPASGSSTPLSASDPPNHVNDDANMPNTDELESATGPPVVGASGTVDKLAGLSLNTTGARAVTDAGHSSPTIPTSPSSSPVANSSNANPTQRPTSSSSRTSLSAYPYGSHAVPLTSISQDAPALQSFVPVPVARSKSRIASGSAGDGGRSTSPPGVVFVKEEEGDADSPIIKSSELDTVTQAAVQAALRNENGLRGSHASRKSESVAPLTAEKKRPPPKKSMAGKKGTAKRAAGLNTVKKRKDLAKAPVYANGKMDDDTEMELDEDELSFDEEDGEDDEELYCICRKPDDHKYMIACDGGCSDWFHGACIKITEDQGRVIDKFICPNCSLASGGVQHTTWRPVCRFPDCGNPARVEAGANVVSLYCSDEHGRAFWTAFVRDQHKAGSKFGRVKKSTKALPDSKVHNGYVRGGLLSPAFLKALLANVTTAEAFQSLGKEDELPTPPEIDMDAFDALSPPEGLSPEDVAELITLSKQRTSLIDRRMAAQNRSKLLTYAISRRDRCIVKLGVKRNAWCGFDADLVLSPPELTLRVEQLDNQAIKREGSDGMDIEEEVPDSICQRKNCSVHPKWADAEKQDCWQEMRMWSARIDELEVRVNEIGQAAMRRGTFRAT